MATLPLESPCKINLCLRVHEKLKTGYHRIETVMVKVGLSDRISISIHEGEGINVRVPGFPELETETNLAVRAARAFLDRAKISKQIQIAIEKKVPMGGGLGGGSGNAGAVLKALSSQLKKLDQPSLLELAASIGADVPFFVSPNSICLAEGTGTKLTPWPPLSSIPVVIVNPGFSVSTAEAYNALNRSLTWKHPNGTSIAPATPPEKWSDLERLLEVGNDFEGVVERLHPEVAQIKKELRETGAFFARMSGSGSSVFGLFEDEKAAGRAAKSLKERWDQTFQTKTLND